MNISKEQIDDLNIVVSVQIGNADYGDKVGEVLRDFRRKAKIPGFRPGKVPEGLIRKMYGKGVLIDEINKIVSESLQNYIQEQDLKLLGDPLPVIKEDELDWEIGTDFTFDFEMGLQPNVEVNLSKDDLLTKYQVTVEQNMIKRDMENFASRFGQFIDIDAVVDFTEKLTGDIVQLDDDNQPLPEELAAEDTTMSLLTVKDEKLRKPFENAKAGDEIVFQLAETFPNQWELASILKKKDREEVGDISGLLFKLTLKTIQKFVHAKIDQELFDKVYGEGVVTSLEEFENRISKNIASGFEEGILAKFGNDAREYLLEKINPPLPEKFLHKWLLKSNNEIDEETIEKEFPMFLKNMKWDLIANAIIRKNELQVNEQEIIDSATIAARKQFAMYGINNFSDEEMNGYVMNYLKDEKSVRATASKALESKITKVILETVDVTVQETSLEDFNHMIYGSGGTGEVEEIEEAEENAESVKITDNIEITEVETIETVDEAATVNEVETDKTSTEIETISETEITKKKRGKKSKKISENE